MCLPACRIIHTGKRSTDSPRAARNSKGSDGDDADDDDDAVEAPTDGIVDANNSMDKINDNHLNGEAVRRVVPVTECRLLI
jgi:hypothetical protein